MNTEPIIKVRNLSKKYHIKSATSEKNNYGFFSALKLPYKMLNEVLNPYADKKFKTIWALDKINFQVFKGERIGIIGNNGAGKSTLLKILSRLIYPTEGEARIYGRVNSLLEVGTGFNPNLTGRENIYLNATLHGLNRSEINKRFNDIVEFSGVGKFIETPIKYYSSGMYMRLAFSVAAHLDADILLLDEVLAVGDMSFQQKCLQRVEGLTSHGSTVLFVSHSLGDINRFCDRCIWIEDGKIVQDGSSADVTKAYTEKTLQIKSNLFAIDKESSQNENMVSGVCLENNETILPGLESSAKLISAQIVNSEWNPVSVVEIDKRTGIEFVYEVIGSENNYVPSMALLDKDGKIIFCAADYKNIHLENIRKKGVHKSIAWIPSNFLNEGNYFVNIGVVSPEFTPMKRHFYIEKALSFYATETVLSSECARGIMPRKFPGPIRPKLEWGLY